MSGRATLFMLATTLLVSAGSVTAQQRRPIRPGNRLQMEERVRQRFDDIVRTQLGLNGDQAERLTRVVQSFQAERQALLRRERELRRRVRQGAGGLAPGRGGSLMSEEQARAALREMTDLRRVETELQQQEMEQLLEVLTPGQLVRFYLLREEMADRLTRLRRPPAGGALGPFGPSRPGGDLGFGRVPPAARLPGDG